MIAMETRNVEAWLDEFGQRYALPKKWNLAMLDSLQLATLLDEHLRRKPSNVQIEQLILDMINRSEVWTSHSALVAYLETPP
jgi:hypothetical protein